MKVFNLRRPASKGFTLLELLIVIGILAILSLAVVFVLNPAETLKKSRDAQRISDLAALKTAVALYTTSVASPDLDFGGTALCLSTTNSNAVISYSAEIADVSCATTVAKGTDAATASAFSTSDNCRYVATGASAVDGNGWVPVELTKIAGGSPLSNLPMDPVNSMTNGTSTASAPNSGALAYRYACQSVAGTGKPSNVFEINAQLESDAYTSDDDRRAKDGGDNAGYYEVGTNLKLIGTGSNF